ncbi:unnamed protein product [Parnassius apollo]|uniref:(apollo) hypothetical protein n=1 Tax=Parnassius apollo TaxID=110799 RepID=A0A8S3X1I7_PARAO|nr:unnamed protein product [Parnassius apollo]
MKVANSGTTFIKRFLLSKIDDDPILQIKNGKVNYEAAIKQADLLLPEEIKEHAKAALTACRKVPDSYNNICEAAFYMTKCVHRENPAAFFFP